VTRALTTVLPGLVVAGTLVIAYMIRTPESGIAVRAVAVGCWGKGAERSCAPRPYGAHVRITKPARRETIAGATLARGQTVRFKLARGSYVVRPDARGERRARPVEVLVRRGRFAQVTLRYERVEGRKRR
jgi:hypothetical protein